MSDLCEGDLVTVVIPTLNRANLLRRALTSVFAQTHTDLEVIVVVDGPDHATIAMLQDIDDPRLQVIVNPRSLTAAGARNVGIDTATGKWIAFLDDDDEWLPNKISTQLAFLQDGREALVTCLSKIVFPTHEYVRPEVIFDNSTPIDEYLFDRRSLFSGIGFVQTSGYFLRRSLLNDVRFRIDTPHDDWDLLLRLSKQFNVRVETIPQVLVIIHIEEARASLSKSGTWLASLRWFDSIRPIITRRAYSGFCLGVVGPRAAKERAYKAFPLLLYRAFRYGAPRPWRIVAFIGMWLMPKELIRRLMSLRAQTGPLGARS